MLRPASIAIALALLVARCGDSATEPHTGSLVIPAVSGLPDGSAPVVTILGPGGFSRTVATSGKPDTLDALAPGAYVIKAADITIGNARWSATPATQSVGVYDGYRLSAAEIVYAVSSARLLVSVQGLPAATASSVTITGPGNFQRVVSATSTLEPLEPGTYTVTAGDVQSGGRTYRPGPATQTVTLAAGGTGSIVVDHGTGSATLDVAIAGLSEGTDAAVTVTGPGGYTRTVTASRRLEHLEPGSYTVSAATFAGSLATYAPTVATQVQSLAAAGSATTTVTYGATPLTLGVDLVVEGLSNPSFLTAPQGDARLFIVERSGRVRIVTDGVLRVTPFLDIRSRVNSAGERGMLGMAFDPQYASTGRFYVYYVGLSGNMVVERFESTAGSDVAGASAGVVISIEHGGSEHHGGTVAFGPDGMLYVAPGDGGCCGDPRDNAQNTNVLLGKMLRLDVRSSPTYTIPAGNPFVGRTGTRPEIWALGFRNPWRFSFDAPSGMLYLGDVGQDAREEVDVVPATAAGRNFGWPIMEGNACYKPSSDCNRAGLTLPVEEYTHAEGCSVTGGYVYRGAAIPELTGHYLYGDYCRGWLRSFRLTSARTAAERRMWAGVTVSQLLSFGRDGAGELYAVSGAGRVWRIVKR